MMFQCHHLVQVQTMKVNIIAKHLIFHDLDALNDTCNHDGHVTSLKMLFNNIFSPESFIVNLSLTWNLSHFDDQHSSHLTVEASSKILLTVWRWVLNGSKWLHWRQKFPTLRIKKFSIKYLQKKQQVVLHSNHVTTVRNLLICTH